MPIMFAVLSIIPIFLFGLISLVYTQSRPGVFFGNSVPVAFPSSPVGQQILRNYRIRAVALLILAAVAALYVLHQRDVRHVSLIIFCQVFLGIANMTVAVRQTSRYAIQPPLVRTASLTVRSTRKLEWVGYLTAALPLACAAVYLHLHWAQIPEVFPAHWGFNGQPNRWAHRSFFSVYGPLLIGAGVTVTTILSSRAGRNAGAVSRSLIPRAIPLVIAVQMSLMFSVLAVSIALPGFRTAGSHDMAVHVVEFVLADLILMIIVLAAMVPNIVKSSAEAPTTGEPYDGTPDKCWYLGLFYYNRNDPNIWVQKRLGFGYTWNFARPATWPVMALAVGSIVFGIIKSIHK